MKAHGILKLSEIISYNLSNDGKRQLRRKKLKNLNSEVARVQAFQAILTFKNDFQE